MHPQCQVDYTQASTLAEIKFKTNIPSRVEWEEGRLDHSESLKIYTDGSKIDDRVGLGVHSQELHINISKRLPNFCSVLQAEVRAIHEAARIIQCSSISMENICVFTDSQAAIRSLRSKSGNSKTIISQ